jgi:hypothetical protein
VAFQAKIAQQQKQIEALAASVRKVSERVEAHPLHKWQRTTTDGEALLLHDEPERRLGREGWTPANVGAHATSDSMQLPKAQRG